MTPEQIEKLKSLVEEKMKSLDVKSSEFDEWNDIFWGLVGINPVVTSSRIKP